VDDECRPWAFVLTPGNTADCIVAEKVLKIAVYKNGMITVNDYPMSGKGMVLSFNRVQEGATTPHLRDDPTLAWAR
jgi:hypothetical protein